MSLKGGPRAGALILLGVAAAGLGAGCGVLGDDTVTRRVHGHTHVGHFVSEDAYLAYAEGAIAEARGEHDRALAAYQRAADEDPRSADPWTRIAAVRCARGDATDATEAAFARAMSRDATYAPAFAERARCRLSRGDAERALGDAETAVRLDPSDPTTTLGLAACLRALGRDGEAARWLRGLRAHAPGEPRAQAELSALTASAGAPERRPLSDVDAALAASDLSRARRAAAGKLSSAELALRAAALGAMSLAREQALLVLGAEPTSADARVALLVAGDALADASAVERALSAVPERTAPPSALAALLLREVLSRRAGEGAAEAIAIPNADERDPLVARVRARIAASHGAPRAM